MQHRPAGSVAVIFISRRSEGDDVAYGAAATAMAEEAARQPGYLGVESVRDAEGHGITISFWQDEASAVAWRNHAEHSTIRDKGRERWYESYSVIVADVGRSYDWQKKGPARRPAHESLGEDA
jgi:heme-degrading monooxygenase HmoA